MSSLIKMALQKCQCHRRKAGVAQREAGEQVPNVGFYMAQLPCLRKTPKAVGAAVGLAAERINTKICLFERLF